VRVNSAYERVLVLCCVGGEVAGVHERVHVS